MFNEWTLIGLVIVLTIVLVGGGKWLLTGRRRRSTEDS